MMSTSFPVERFNRVQHRLLEMLFKVLSGCRVQQRPGDIIIMMMSILRTSWWRSVGITAGMDHKEVYVVPCRKLKKIRSCSSSTRSSSSFSWCEADSNGLTVHADH